MQRTRASFVKPTGTQLGGTYPGVRVLFFLASGCHSPSLSTPFRLVNGYSWVRHIMIHLPTRWVGPHFGELQACASTTSFQSVSEPHVAHEGYSNITHWFIPRLPLEEVCIAPFSWFYHLIPLSILLERTTTNSTRAEGTIPLASKDLLVIPSIRKDAAPISIEWWIRGPQEETQWLDGDLLEPSKQETNSFNAVLAPKPAWRSRVLK